MLAACSTVVPKGQVPDKPATDEPGNVVTGDATRHRIALLLPVTGPDGEMGQAIANATTLALLDTKNTNIRMTTYDTALGVDAAAKRAIADGNKLILGPLRGDQVVDTANVATPAGVPGHQFFQRCRCGKFTMFSCLAICPTSRSTGWSAMQNRKASPGSQE